MYYPDALNFLGNYGFMFCLTALLIFFGYKYMNIKFKVLEKNLTEQLKPHFWEVGGNITEVTSSNGTIKKVLFTIEKKYVE